MPTFDRSSSRRDRAETALLRAVLGLGRAGTTPLHVAARGYRRSRRRAMLGRALIVATLVGCFSGSAIMMRVGGPQSFVEAKRLTPADLDPITTGSIVVTSDGCRADLGRRGGRASSTNARSCAMPEDRLP
jgi:hypothetical protein